jgi:hypothetical protein
MRIRTIPVYLRPGYDNEPLKSSPLGKHAGDLEGRRKKREAKRLKRERQKQELASNQSTPLRKVGETSTSKPKVKSVSRPATKPKTPSITDMLATVRSVAAAATATKGSQVDLPIGFVYIVTNPAWPGHVKIGCALDYEQRLASYQTSCPLRDYRLEYVQFFEDRRAGERAVHFALAACRVEGTEWFKACLSGSHP